MLREIEARAPQVQVLLTARDRLNLPPAEIFLLESLSYPEDDGDWQIEQHSAVHLFVQLARSHLPDFVVNDEQRFHIARICRLVGGLPLGIELAAAWVRVLACESIARQIEANLTLLGPLPSGEASQAHLMLAMVDSLWNLLSENERSLLRRMAVFRGSFSAAAADEVTGASLFFLEALVSKGYLRWNRMQRFEAHELLRQYAAARLDTLPDEQHEAQERHSRYYLQLLRQPALLQDGSQQTVIAVNADYENIRAAWDWVVQHQELDVIFQHIEGLEMFYDLKGSFHEAEAMFEEAIIRLSPALPPTSAPATLQRVIARLFTARARFLIRLSLYDQARQAAERAYTISGALQDTLIEAHSLYHIGTVIWRKGEYQRAEEYFQHARDLAHQGDVLTLEADCLRRLSRVACDMGRYDEAHRYGAQSLAICRATAERQRESRMLNDLGIIADSQGDYAASRAYYEQCLRICRLIGDRPGEASALHNLGAGAADQGQYAESEAHLEQALRIFREIGLLQDEAIVIENLGDSARLQGDLDKAQTCYQQALHICREIGDRQGQAFLLANLGLIAHQSGANSAANELCGAALELARTINDRRAEANALMYHGHALVELEQLVPAAELYRQAAEILAELGQQRLAAEPIAGLARIALIQGDEDHAALQIEPLLPLLESESLEGATEPMRVFLTAYQVLEVCADPRAGSLLQRAITMLDTKAASIIGDDRRQRFLANLPAHRALIEAAARHESAVIQQV
ncbi:MAG: tetratricopeptide repeat protein [Oscillochloris sp.]|nr:tetratricopeptide repeat protein [Oscillochloris sp.]